MTIAQKAVARGVALLDERIPDWYLEINTDEFDVDYHCKCIIGQLFRVKNYLNDDGMLTQTAMNVYHGAFENFLGIEYDPVYYGFEADALQGTDELNEEWLKVIEARCHHLIDDMNSKTSDWVIG